VIDPRLRSAKLHADADRLGAQVDLSWAKELEILNRAGLRDGLALLDVGCGPGFMAERLLREFPNSTVTGVELDPEMAAMAASRLAWAGERASVVIGSAHGLDLDDHGFDIAIARLVLQHLAAPDLTLGEMRRVLRPGGSMAIIDVDDAIGGLTDPPIRGFAAVGQKTAELQANFGGNRYVGRHMDRLARGAGFVDVRLEAIALSSAELGLEPFLPQFRPERFLTSIANGGISQQEWEAYREGFEAFLNSPSPLILQIILIASGRKPWEDDT
jgi:SAM-dependent methyltransferase